MQADRFKDVFSEDNIASKIAMTGTNGGKIQAKIRNKGLQAISSKDQLEDVRPQTTIDKSTIQEITPRYESVMNPTTVSVNPYNSNITPFSQAETGKAPSSLAYHTQNAHVNVPQMITQASAV